MKSVIGTAKNLRLTLNKLTQKTNKYVKLYTYNKTYNYINCIS